MTGAIFFAINHSGAMKIRKFIETIVITKWIAFGVKNDLLVSIDTWLEIFEICVFRKQLLVFILYVLI